MSSKIIKGDVVTVLTGRDKGKTGDVLRVFPKVCKALVSGVNTVVRHTKQSQNSPGGKIPKELPIHLSNLSLIDPKDKAPTRVGFKMVDGKKVRVSKRSGELIDG
jgi:large subunit ribosomal protein L24